jgi:uncharacterized membrane protein
MPAPNLAPHVEATVRSIARLHADHHKRSSRVQKIIDRLSLLVSRPSFAGLVGLWILFWIGANLLAVDAGRSAIDAPPFPWLAAAASIGSLFISLMILATQRREDELARRRDQLTLELAILSEQKTAKVIQLLEELRADSPHVSDRVDPEADAMASPTDAQSMLDAVEHIERGRD